MDTVQGGTHYIDPAERRDAEAFASFAFNEATILNRGTTDDRSEELVTEEQWERLS